MNKLFLLSIAAGLAFAPNSYAQKNKNKNKNKSDMEVLEYYELPIVQIRQNGKMGFAEKGSLKPITAVEYDEYSSSYGFSLQYPLTSVAINEKYGLINAEGKLLTELKYGNIDILNEGRGYVVITDYKTEKKGILDREGKEAAPPIYNDLEYYFKERDLFAVQKGNLWGVYDLASRQEVVPCEYSSFNWLSTDYIALENKKGDWGCMQIQNGKATAALPFNYDDIALKVDNNSTFAIKQGDEWAFVDSKNLMEKLEKPYDFIQAMYQCKFYLVLQNELWGIANPDGSWLFEPQFDNDIIYFEDGTANALIAGKAAIITDKGEVLIQTNYELMQTAPDKTIRVLLDGKYGLIRQNGDIMTPLEYDFIGEYEHAWYGLDDFTLAKKGDKYGFLDKKGKAFSDFNYISCGCQYNNSEVGWITHRAAYFDLMSVSPDGINWGLIDNKGKVVLPFEYEKIECVYEGEISYIYKKGKEMQYNWKERKMKN